MAENNECTHDCSSCGADCPSRGGEAIQKEKLNPRASVKHVVGVVSGKGGVGKSIVTSMLAVEMNRRGKTVAVLDADITGPSIPKAFGAKRGVEAVDDVMIPHYTKTGIQLMSVNLLLEDEASPVVWRGPVIAGAVKQFWTDVVWQDVDYMFVDMPPGTGDVPLTVFQSLPLDGIIIVTTPQELVSMIVEKAVNMAKLMNIPIVGLVENMSYAVCPDCGKRLNIFGESKAQKAAEQYGIPLLAQIPLDGKLASLVDSGEVEQMENDYISPAADAVEGVE
ncbi:MAG: Mrp/NBP35 family ATP-binding protein [Clostridia bacterium]|nr:Mrp/NBP35 family ATP-binding protein [Clostridia bacterium]